MAMQRFAIGATLVILLAATVPAAQALTPAQSTAAATKARADWLARTKAQALAKAKADAVVKARTDAAAKTKTKFQTLLNVRAETKRRVEAATKAAEANTQVTSFRATSSPTAPRKVGHVPVPGKVADGMHHQEGDHDHHHEGDHDHHHGAATGHEASSGHAH
jgi:hypothetical protein